MGGLNSLRGLDNVNLDFRPTIELNAPNKDRGNATQAEASPANVQQPGKAEAKSVVCQLDVLLLNAAVKSVSADAAAAVKTTSDKLVDLGVLSEDERSELNSLAKDASKKLKELNTFSGRELAKALMQDKKTGETVWSKGLFGMSSAAKAVKAAIEAQQALSEKLGELFNERLGRASKGVVDISLQEQFMELQFQCDRRASEIDSIVFRMYDLAQKDVVAGAAADPQTKALLNATFKELMPREAIMMHGTAEAFETLNKHMAKQMRPLAAKLDAFAAQPARFLDTKELGALRRDMATMKNAIADVRANGIEIRRSDESVSRIEVDKSLLDALEKILEGASKKIGFAKSNAAGKAREAFLEDVGATLSPLDAPGGRPVMGNQSAHSIMLTLMKRKNELVKMLLDFASDKEPMDKFDAAFDKLAANYDRDLPYDLEQSLMNMEVEPSLARSVARAVGGLNLVKAQFKEMMESTAKLKNDADFGLAAVDVRRIMLGEKGLSNVVNAKALGFKADDVDPATEGPNIVGSRLLGAGAGGTAYLVTSKSGEEFVFKPELDSRLGLSTLALGAGTAYLDTQKTAHLNLATQDTAKALGCEDVVVKYSVGSHDGQFGVFMEKAKGYTGSDFAAKKKAGGNGIAPADMLKTITNPDERLKVKGSLAQKLNRLRWLDMITGQGDRHWENYFVNIEKNAEKNTYKVTVKGIDNDASFSSWQVGLQKYALDNKMAAHFDEQLKSVCEKVNGRGWKTEYENRVSQDPAITRNRDGTVTVDIAKAKSPEIKMAIVKSLGLQSIALPEEIDKDFYDKLMDMDKDPAKKQAFLDTLKPRISPDALNAAEQRLNDAIAHAKKLNLGNKVYGDDQWRDPMNLNQMPEIKSKVPITKSNGKTVEVDDKIECVRDFCVRNCPSLYTRDALHNIFESKA